MGNLEAIELGLRQALLRDGRYLLEQLLLQAGVNLADNTSRLAEKCDPDRTNTTATFLSDANAWIKDLNPNEPNTDF